MHEHAHGDVLVAHDPLEGPAAERRRRHRGAAVAAVAGVGRPGAVRPRRPGAQELGDVHEAGEAGRLHLTLVDLRGREGRGLRLEQDQAVGVGDEVAVEEPRQVPGGLLHQLVEIGGASGAEEVDGLNHAFRAVERLQRLVELFVPIFETTTVGDRRRHAVRARVQPRRRSPAGLRLQQLAQAYAPGGGRPVGAGQSQRAKRRARQRRDLGAHGRVRPGEPAMRVDQAVQVVPEPFGRAAVVSLIALEQLVGGEPVPVLEALGRGRPARAQQVVGEGGSVPTAVPEAALAAARRG